MNGLAGHDPSKDVSVPVGRLVGGLLHWAAAVVHKGEPQMAVMIYSSEDNVSVRRDDDENGHWSYKVLGSGVLQLLVTRGDKTEWTVETEYAPTSWHKVQGTRYIGDTAAIAGADGAAPLTHYDVKDSIL